MADAALSSLAEPVAGLGSDEEVASGLLAGDRSAAGRRNVIPRVCSGLAVLSLMAAGVYVAAPERRLSNDCGVCPGTGEQMVYNSAARTCVCAWCAGSSFANVQLMCRAKCFIGKSPMCAQCFPDAATVSVEVESGAVRPRMMSQLRVGDRVLTEAGFSKVFAFMDHAVGVETEFVRVATDSGHVLALTPEHLVFAHEERRAVLAGSLVSGDLLWAAVANQSGSFARSRVSSVARVAMGGMHAPLTEQGSVVVDGLLASSYAALRTVRWADFPIMSGHDLGRYLHEPLRLACSVVPALCGPEWHTPEGRHLWTQLLLDRLGWLQALNEAHSDIRDALLVRPSAVSWLAAGSQLAAAAVFSLAFGFGLRLSVAAAALSAKLALRRRAAAKQRESL